MVATVYQSSPRQSHPSYVYQVISRTLSPAPKSLIHDLQETLQPKDSVKTTVKDMAAQLIPTQLFPVMAKSVECRRNCSSLTVFPIGHHITVI